MRCLTVLVGLTLAIVGAFVFFGVFRENPEMMATVILIVVALFWFYGGRKRDDKDI